MGTEEKMPSDGTDADRAINALVGCDWLCNELTKLHVESNDRDHRHHHHHHHHHQARGGMLVLDCRGACDYGEGHIRGSVALAVPSIMLRRLAAGKVELLSTIKCQELRSRVEQLLGGGGKFVLVGNRGAEDEADLDDNRRLEEQENLAPRENNSNAEERYGNMRNSASKRQTETIHVLARRLRSAGGQVALLRGGYTQFRDRYPEWCEGGQNFSGGPMGSDNTNEGDLMGLRSLRISSPISPNSTNSKISSTQQHISNIKSYAECDSAHNTSFDSYVPEDDKDFPVQILPHLFLGNAANSEDSEALARHRIYYVLNVTPDLPNVFESEGSIKYMQIPISDHWSQNLASFFPQAIQFIEEARNSDKGVLVHCLAGISRSVTVTVAYLMHKCNLSLNDAFTLVRDRKANIAPNFHFMEQLHSFENELRARGHRISSAEGQQRCIGACRPGGTCNCPQPSFAGATTDMGLSPDSGIEFDRWTGGTPAE